MSPCRRQASGGTGGLNGGGPGRCSSVPEEAGSGQQASGPEAACVPSDGEKRPPAVSKRSPPFSLLHGSRKERGYPAPRPEAPPRPPSAFLWRYLSRCEQKRGSGVTREQHERGERSADQTFGAVLVNRKEVRTKT